MESQHTPASTGAASNGYESNPFKIVLPTLKTLWSNGKSSIWKILGIQVLVIVGVIAVGAIAIGAILVSAFGIFADFVGGAEKAAEALYTMAPVPLDAANALIYAKPIAITLGLTCLAILTILVAFMQALQIAYVSKTIINNEKPGAKQVFGVAIRRMWPMLVQSLVVFAAVFLGVFLPLMIFAFLPDGVGAVLIVLFVLAFIPGVFYLTGRFTMSPFPVVNSDMGPIAGLKHSWVISKGKVSEVWGAISVAMAVATVASFTVSIVYGLLIGLNIALITMAAMIVSLFVSVGVSLGVSSIIAKRYAQIDHAHKAGLHGHNINWGANIGAIALAIAVSIAVSYLDSLVNPAPNLENFSPSDSTSAPANADLDAELQDIYNNIDKYQNQSGDLQTDMPSDFNYEQYFNEQLNSSEL
ncbi:MAG TPA: hypothetical protein VLA77_04190 [Candidatus Saccharimonadales bacterium]|nr:hypothetical protein [Candidatus Saccharimonadales bacterium]